MPAGSEDQGLLARMQEAAEEGGGGERGEGKPILLIFRAGRQETVSKIVKWKKDSSVPRKVTKVLLEESSARD